MTLRWHILRLHRVSAEVTPKLAAMVDRAALSLQGESSTDCCYSFYKNETRRCYVQPEENLWICNDNSEHSVWWRKLNICRGSLSARSGCGVWLWFVRHNKNFKKTAARLFHLTVICKNFWEADTVMTEQHRMQQQGRKEHKDPKYHARPAGRKTSPERLAVDLEDRL